MVAPSTRIATMAVTSIAGTFEVVHWSTTFEADAVMVNGSDLVVAEEVDHGPVASTVRRSGSEPAGLWTSSTTAAAMAGVGICSTVAAAGRFPGTGSDVVHSSTRFSSSASGVACGVAWLALAEPNSSGVSKSGSAGR